MQARGTFAETHQKAGTSKGRDNVRPAHQKAEAMWDRHIKRQGQCVTGTSKGRGDVRTAHQNAGPMGDQHTKGRGNVRLAHRKAGAM